MNHKHLIAMAIAAMISTPVMAQSAPQADPAAAKQAAPAATKAEDKPASNAQILRDKIKADKKLVVAKNMNLTESEAKTFWPLYDAYQKDLDALNKRTGKMVDIPRILFRFEGPGRCTATPHRSDQQETQPGKWLHNILVKNDRVAR